MSGFEWNKIAGAVLLAGLIAMVVGTVADSLYQPYLSPKKRGYAIEVADSDQGAGGEAAKEEVIDVPTLLAAGNPDEGLKISKKCTACHSLDKGGPNKVGPDLWSVVGRPKAAHEGFSYSDAMKGKGGSWDYDSLFHFLKAPKNFVPGTKMTFAGFSKPQDVANIIAYLRTLSENPVPLPTPAPAPTAAENAASAPAKDASASAPVKEEEKSEQPAAEQPASEATKVE
jgi:cytochrome c